MQNDNLKIIDNYSVSMEERLHAAEKLKTFFSPDLDSVCEVDLHCHSFCSDGYFSPANKVFEAYRREMKGIAIADHDVFDGQFEALAAGEIFEIDVIPAIEFYTDRPGVEVIGHFPDVEAFRELMKSGVAKPVIESIRKAKKEQLEGMVNRIPGCFANLDFEAEINSFDIDRFVRNGISAKGDISVIMWQKYGCELRKSGLADDVKDFQSKYTTQDDMLNLPLHVAIDLSPASFVKRIRSWGGLPGISHPTELRGKEGLGNKELRSLIKDLALIGLQTIEVDGWRNGVCPEIGINQTDLFEQIRKEISEELKFEILFTNGSDDHNQPGEGLELGCGRNNNLRPEFGKYENIIKLRQRANQINE